MLTRLLDSDEKIFIQMKCYTQLVIELEDNSKIPEYVHKIQKYLFGFHLKSDGKSLILHHDKQPVYDLPRGMKDYKEICDWMYINLTPPTSKALAAIATRDNIIGININHLCGDGKTFKILTEALPLPEQDVKYAIPPSPFALFKDEITKIIRSGLKPYFLNEDPNLSRIIPKEKPDNILKSGGFNVQRSHVSKLVCNTNGVIKGLTESLWTAGTLTIAAYNGTLSPCGASTPVDLRPYIKGHFDKFEVCNSIGKIPVYAEMIPDETVGDLGRRMREDFQRKNKNNEALGYQAATYRVIVEGNPFPPAPGMGFELSNVGPVKLKRPIKDILMSCIAPAGPSHDCSCITFSTISEIPEFNQIVTDFLFSNQTLSLHDAVRINKSIQYALTHIKPEMKIKDALDELTKFQSQQ